MNHPIFNLPLTKTPDYSDNPVLSIAFVDFVRFALSDDDMRQAFEADTGESFAPLIKATPLERAIDQATGREAEILAAFVDWVTVNHWGEEGESEGV